jgi:hypothetical protein
MPTLSLTLTLSPCGTQGELYVPITIGNTSLKALVDTGSGALLTVQNVPNNVTYKRRPQVNTLTLPNIPLGLNCALQCTDQPNSACFFSQDKACELHFGTGDLSYNPILESVQLGSMKHPAFYIALADTEENFPFPIACIMGISHYKYSDDSPLGSLCAKGKHGVLINQTTVMFQLFQHLGGGNCLVDTQTIRLAYDDKDRSVSFAVPIPSSAPHVPMVTTMLPFYAVTLTSLQVGAVTHQFSSPQIVILDSGTSSGGSLAPEVYDSLANTLVRYTNGLSGLSINDAQVQGVSPDKLGLFPPIAFTWGQFTHVMEPATYMIAENCGKPNLINVFSRGTDNVSVLGNVALQHLAITFDLLKDRVYFERLSGPEGIDRNYPSPAAPLAPGKTALGAMTASVQAGESVNLPAPKVRRGIPQAVISKMAATPLNIDVFGSALVDNQCCLYNAATAKKQDVGSFAGGGSTSVDGATTSTNGPWSTRNIVLLVIVSIVLAASVWALVKYGTLVKKQKNLQ